ncbi:unnamed protein product [Prorocentrum cordatum]|uniref:Uncharacterized protein n=1 Tax=Prorocentrum cordatum TaxID=2364126 RepID=A0ABN9WLS1_9DINO|nr:unnamed protein product [Polarella glacialis]
MLSDSVSLDWSLMAAPLAGSTPGSMGTLKAWATRRTDVPLTGRGSGQVSRPVTSLLISDRSLRGQEAAISGSRSPQGLRILRIPSGPRTPGPGTAPPWATLRGRPRAILGVEGCLGAGAAALEASAHASAGLGRCW